VAVVVLLLAAAAQAKGGEVDILGRQVPVPGGRPSIIVYANRATGDPIQLALADVSARLADVKPLVVVRVDLRDLPGIFKGYASSRIRTRYEDGLKLYGTECRRLGCGPDPHPQDSLFFVSDPDGQSHQSVGLPSGFHEALAVAYDASGREILRVPFPSGASQLESAVRAALTAR
jgi:hypothetical protein